MMICYWNISPSCPRLSKNTEFVKQNKQNKRRVHSLFIFVSLHPLSSLNQTAKHPVTLFLSRFCLCFSLFFSLHCFFILGDLLYEFILSLTDLIFLYAHVTFCYVTWKYKFESVLNKRVLLVVSAIYSWRFFVFVYFLFCPSFIISCTHNLNSFSL